MAIYIKSMMMPVRCVSCPLWKVMVLQSPALDICGAVHRQIYNPYGSSRPGWCPLVEVPPHGRLIDVDAMERQMSDTVQGDIRSYQYSDVSWDMAFRWLDNQPTIIPAEEDDNENHA